MLQAYYGTLEQSNPNFSTNYVYENKKLYVCGRTEGQADGRTDAHNHIYMFIIFIKSKIIMCYQVAQ